MYVEHPYKFNDKFYAKVDGKFYEITREVAKAMLSAYRNEIYRSKKWQPKNNIPDTGELLFSSGKNLPGSSPVQA